MSLQRYIRQLIPIQENVNLSQFSEAYDIIPKSTGEIDTLEIPHDKEKLKALFDEIVAGSEIKTFNAQITNPDGESFVGPVTRYGLFSASHEGKFVTPISSLNSFQLLAKQPESKITRSLKRHLKADEYSTVSIDPTRGFLLSLYLDKPGWIQRIAQGKSIGFVIILIGIIGAAFSAYKIYKLREYAQEVIKESEGVVYDMTNSVKSNSSRESKENIIDEIIINYSGKIEWGNNWVKFFAAVAPLLGLLGTVIGMIETFQAITLFGTGDPKQMAGGISQALITTMLGLIVAAPLLGMYTYLSEKTSSIIQILEEKASYILSKD